MSETSYKLEWATITSRRDLSDDLWVIRVRPQERLAFKPGQYVALGVEVEGRVIERPFSIASAPHEDEAEFFLEMVHGGGLTPHLHARHVGDKLYMRRQAKGLFTLDTASQHQKHFLVATVTGVAPYVSMVRSRAEQARQGHKVDYEFVVMQGASRPWEFAYQDELEELARQVDWFRYIPTVSRPWEDFSWTGEVGRIEDVLRKYLNLLNLDPVNTTTYLCGHPEMILNCKGILARRGFAKEFIREEVYWVPKKGEHPEQP